MSVLLIGTIGIAVPVLVFFVLGERSRELLDEVRSWMSAHNAAITLLIGFKLLGDGLSGL